MGVELLIGAAVAAASVATGLKQMKASKAANRERKEANEIANAQQKNEAAASTRQAIREARIRRAMIMQQSENTGVADSSGAIGAVGVVGTNLGINAANANAKTTAVTAINNRNQKAADYDYKAARWGAFGNIFAQAGGALQQGLAASK